MHLIVGLGNPGSKYEKTRHNVGFEVIDQLATEYKINLSSQKFEGLFGKGTVEKKPVMLLKPLSYMNLSGEVVSAIIRYFKLDISSFLVIYDDLDLPVGQLRLRETGGSGGHNGIKSLIHELGTEKFKRIRVGIGKPPVFFSTSNYVLSTFTTDEQEIINKSIEKASNAVTAYCKQDFLAAMNSFNQI